VRIRGLYAITPEGGTTTELLEKVRAALEGRIALLQYRRKKRNATEAWQVVELAHSYGVRVVINDDVALALEVGADGAHLGRHDGDLALARKLLSRRILGASCYDDLGAAQAAVRAGADYVAFGSMFASPTKPEAVRAPLSLLGEARALGVPLAAIGGITLENASQALEAGADLLAVISDLFDASDIRARAREYGRLYL
jgi:thiamine-phosphate pyrophosphorylase